MKVWFDVDCEQILFTLRDVCFTCEELCCDCGTLKINEIQQHRQYGCRVAYINEDDIKTVRLYVRDGSMPRLATMEDIEKQLVKAGYLPNFAYGLAKIINVEHKVIK